MGVFLVLAVVLAVLTVPLTGGRLARLAEVRLRWVPLLFGAVVLQVLILGVVDGWPEVLLRAAHLASYGMLFALLWANRRIPGLWIVAAGGALNFVAIAANGGVMPAGPAAVRSAGIEPTSEFVNSAVQTHPRLLFLGDIWSIPEGWPLANVFSIGDIVIAVGVFVVVHALARAAQPTPSPDPLASPARAHDRR